MPSHDPDYRNMKNPIAVSAVTQKLAGQVYEHAKEGRLVLTLGGDHSIAIGTVAGTSRAIRERLGREMAVIWVDAHADINTPESSDSGNIHGMPVAFLTGLAQKGSAEKRQDIFGWLDDKEGPFAGEAKLSLRSWCILAYGMWIVGRRRFCDARGSRRSACMMLTSEFSSLSPLTLLRRAVADLSTQIWHRPRNGTRPRPQSAPTPPVHLSFDVDALDPQWAPSTGTPVRGGLTLREGDYIAECVHETGSLVAMDLVEVNPSLEAQGAAETVRAGCSLVRCALGDTLL